jgi:hypothetical protein
LLDACLDLIGPLKVADQTHAALLAFAERGGSLDLSRDGRAAEQRVGELLSLIVSTREFQFA